MATGKLSRRDPVSRAPTCSLCPGCSRWTGPPTGFEPASSWRSNAPTRRSPRAVGKLTARRAMTPDVPCGLKERTVSSTARYGNRQGTRHLNVTTQSVAVHCQFPSAPEGNRTPDLQLERLASLANGDSGSITAMELVVPSAWGRTRTSRDRGNSPEPPPGGSPRHREGPTGFEPAILRLKAARLSS